MATTSPMTLIPLASMSDLYPTVLSLRKRLNQAPGKAADTGPGGVDGVSTFFSNCLGRVLTGGERAALRRIHITSVQDLAQKAADPQGQAMLRKHLDEELVKKVIGFFDGEGP